MDTPIAVAVISAVAAVVASAFAYWSSTKATKASEQGTAIEWARELRQQTKELSGELTAARSEVAELVGYLRRVLHIIHEPEMTIERARELVPADLPRIPQSRNGIGH